MRMFHTFMGGAILVQHSGTNDFDMNFLSRKYRPSYEMPFINTRTLLKKMYPSIGAYDLDSVSQAFRIDLINHHRAPDDAVTTSWIFLKLLEKLEENDISNILEVEQHLGRVLKAK